MVSRSLPSRLQAREAGPPAWKPLVSFLSSLRKPTKKNRGIESAGNWITNLAGRPEVERGFSRPGALGGAPAPFGLRVSDRQGTCGSPQVPATQAGETPGPAARLPVPPLSREKDRSCRVPKRQGTCRSPQVPATQAGEDPRAPRCASTNSATSRRKSRVPSRREESPRGEEPHIHERRCPNVACVAGGGRPGLPFAE